MTSLIDILNAYGLKKSDGACVFSKFTDASGDHWITVHPNGAGGKGQPVLISKGGEVLGGMGGKFNGMHISAARGSGDPLSGGNVRLQGEKWAAAHPKKKESSAHIKAPKGWKQAHGHEYGENEVYLNIESGNNTFHVPRTEVTLSKKGEVTHVSPELNEWMEKYEERSSAFMKQAREAMAKGAKAGDFTVAEHFLERLPGAVHAFSTPESRKRQRELNAEAAKNEPVKVVKSKPKQKKVEKKPEIEATPKTEAEYEQEWRKRRGELINTINRYKQLNLF